PPIFLIQVNRFGDPLSIELTLPGYQCRTEASMVAFKINRPGTAAPKPGSSSRSPRRRVLLSGTFHSITSSCPAEIRNLSCTGAAIKCDTALKVGAEGVLQAGFLDCLCRVIWQKGNVFGIKFDQPLHNNIVLDLHRVTEADVRRAQSSAAKEWFETQSR
ncbi:MAG TPA: PilZ domain-containing protein, partial [Allosphingosinicella sp.]